MLARRGERAPGRERVGLVETHGDCKEGFEFRQEAPWSKRYLMQAVEMVFSSPEVQLNGSVVNNHDLENV